MQSCLPGKYECAQNECLKSFVFSLFLLHVDDDDRTSKSGSQSGQPPSGIPGTFKVKPVLKQDILDMIEPEEQHYRDFCVHGWHPEQRY